MLIQGPCDPRRHYFLMCLTSNLESMAYKPFCTGVLSTQRSCARCKAGVASQRQANFSAGMSFASLKHGEGIVNWIHHSLHIFHSSVIKISLLVSENLDGVSQTLKNRNQWSRSMLGDPSNSVISQRCLNSHEFAVFHHHNSICADVNPSLISLLNAVN